MRFLLADDHAMFRSGLCRILTEGFPRVEVQEVSSCEEVLRKLREPGWDLLILDIAMGDQNSLGILPKIKAMCPAMPVLVLSMYNDRQFVVQALRDGAAGYLTKENAPDELLRAIRTILSGHRYINETMAEHMADYLAAGDEALEPHETLSAREYEVFLLIAAGRSLTEIAGQLALSVKTVSTYRTRILEKTGLNSNADLIRYALKNGLTQ